MAKIDTMVTAIVEAERFIAAAEKCKQCSIIEGDVDDGRESAAMKRASLDLTNILADLRQGR